MINQDAAASVGVSISASGSEFQEDSDFARSREYLRVMFCGPCAASGLEAQEMSQSICQEK